MKKIIQPIKITQEHARQVVLNSVFPECTISVIGVPFTFKFTDHSLPPIGGIEQLQFMERVLCCKSFKGTQFVRELPPIFYKELLQEFISFQTIVGDQLFRGVEEYAKTSESRNYWEVFKSVGPALTINLRDGKLNAFQRKWVLLNTIQDKQENVKLIENVFDILKPWLNLDLFAKMQEVEENRRENVFYNDDNIAQEDARLRMKAQKIAEQAKQNTKIKIDPDDLDEITIEGE